MKIEESKKVDEELRLVIKRQTSFFFGETTLALARTFGSKAEQMSKHQNLKIPRMVFSENGTIMAI